MNQLVDTSFNFKSQVKRFDLSKSRVIAKTINPKKGETNFKVYKSYAQMWKKTPAIGSLKISKNSIKKNTHVQVYG